MNFLCYLKKSFDNPTLAEIGFYFQNLTHLEYVRKHTYLKTLTKQ